MINSAGNYGWPFCTGNQQGYRAKLPATTGGGLAAPVGHPGTVAGGDRRPADGGGFWDCDDPNGIVNDSPFNTGLERIPAARPTNIWYGPQGGCYDFPRNANDIPIYNGAEHGGPTPASVPPLPVRLRRRPGADDRRQLPQAGRRRARTHGRPTGTAAGSSPTTPAATTCATRC